VGAVAALGKSKRRVTGKGTAFRLLVGMSCFGVLPEYVDPSKALRASRIQRGFGPFGSTSRMLGTADIQSRHGAPSVRGKRIRIEKAKIDTSLSPPSVTPPRVLHGSPTMTFSPAGFVGDSHMKCSLPIEFDLRVAS